MRLFRRKRKPATVLRQGDDGAWWPVTLTEQEEIENRTAELERELGLDRKET